MKNYVANLSLRGKFLLIAIAMLVPIGGLSYVAVKAEVEAMNFAISEDNGLDWTQDLINIASNLSEYREHAVAVAFGAEDERAEMNEHAGLIREAAASLDAHIKEGGHEDFAKASGWSELKPRVDAIMSAAPEDAEKIKQIPGLIEDLHGRVQTMTEASG